MAKIRVDEVLEFKEHCEILREVRIAFTALPQEHVKGFYDLIRRLEMVIGKMEILRDRLLGTELTIKG